MLNLKVRMKSAQFFLRFLFVAGFSIISISPQGFSETESNSIRGPQDAVLSIEQFSDFYCGYCKKQAHVLKQLVENYPGKIRWIFRHHPSSPEPGYGSFPIHEASLCAGEQGKFWEFHDFVYALEQNADLNQISAAIHLNQAPFEKCLAESRYRNVILKDIDESIAREVEGTPSFFIDGELVTGFRPYEFFEERLDPVKREARKAARKKAEEDFLKKVNLKEAGRPILGSEKATVVISEFSDLHCSYCAGTAKTIKKIAEAYPQDVRLIWRHFPLPMHPNSPFAHLASECAHEQGKFWEFQEKVFSNSNAAQSFADFEKIANELKLDSEKFKACYENPATKKKIENDILIGAYKKISMTPTLFVNEEKVVGEKSFEDFSAIIQRHLAASKKS